MLFLSTYVNKIDKKGRVSVPSQYRSIISEKKFNGIIMYESLNNESLEACGIDRIEAIYSMIDKIDPYSEERDALSLAILAGSVQLLFDTEGRINIPCDIVEKFNFQDQICFVGKGEIFEIWEPTRFKLYKEKAIELAKMNKNLLQNSIKMGLDKNA